MRRFVFFALLAASPIAAQTPEIEIPDATSAGEVKRKIDEMNERIALASEKEAALLAAIDEMGRDMAARAEDLREIRQLLEEYRATSETKRARMEELERRIADRRQWVKHRLRSLYMHGRPGVLKVLFAADSYADLVRRTKFSRIVARRDSVLVVELKKDLAEVAESRVEYERELVSLEAELERSRSKNEELEMQRAYRETLLAEVTSQKVSSEKLKASLEKAQAALGSAMANLSPSAAGTRPFDDFKGRLLAPVTTPRVKLPYGPYTHPTLGLPMLHQGILYDCALGQDVKAAFEGRVEMASWFSTYGEVLVVDHGGGWRSLYAHNEQLLKKKGDAVREGEVIAKCGATGSFAGPELFFALYREGKPVDPAEWFVPDAQ